MVHRLPISRYGQFQTAEDLGTGDDRAMIYGAMTGSPKAQSENDERARKLWAGRGKEAFAKKQTTDSATIYYTQKD